MRISILLHHGNQFFYAGRLYRDFINTRRKNALGLVRLVGFVSESYLLKLKALAFLGRGEGGGRNLPRKTFE